jgi:hypothetical protein
MLLLGKTLFGGPSHTNDHPTTICVSTMVENEEEMHTTSTVTTPKKAKTTISVKSGPILKDQCIAVN